MHHKNYHILIIDDHPIIAEGVTSRITKVLPNATCYFVTNVRDAIAKINAITIDLVFCDLEFNDNPESDGFYIVAKLLKAEPTLNIIAHTNYNSYRVMKKALNNGFKSFLYKGCSFTDFSDTVVNVLQNGSYVSNSIQLLLKKRSHFLKSVFSESLYGIADLSKRELELTVLTRETTDKYLLAEKMGNTPSTIDSYIQNIISKLNLKSRQEVAMFSLEFYDELLKAHKEK